MRIRSAVVVAKGPDRAHPALGPLATLPVANRALLGHALDAVAAAGVTDAAVVIEPDARGGVTDVVEELRSNGGPLTVHPLELPPGTGLGALLQSAQSVIGDGEFLLHLGDSFCRALDLDWDEDTFEAADALVLVKSGDNGGVGLVGSSRRFAAGDLGVYVVGTKFATAASAVERSGDLVTEVKAALPLLAEHGGRTRHRWHDGWRYSEEPTSLLEANRIALAKIESSRIEAEVIRSEIQEPVEIHPSARVESSVIRGPAAIGAGCRIKEAYIGPHTAIGKNVVIEGAEIGYSVIMDGASVRHLGERLEASIIGQNALVGRGFRLPRALRLEVGAGAEVLLS